MGVSSANRKYGANRVCRDYFQLARHPPTINSRRQAKIPICQNRAFGELAVTLSACLNFLSAACYYVVVSSCRGTRLREQ